MKRNDSYLETKILFLDFDGVLNSKAWIKTPDKYLKSPIEPCKMNLLKRIISETNAKIVLTTSWREFWQFDKKHTNKTGEYIDKIFERYGLSVFSKTPDISFFERDKEVDFWLKDHYSQNVKSFCVLDDVEELFQNNLVIKKHLILTNPNEGISENDVSKAIKMLNKQ